ncbi:peptidylprolyl isomerase [Aurantiacibacter luteus]|uniref:Parvulin-like PPIase n=1 Tax=Aurantiacibacter luteus TaxID=1581420 RepID=A0A0G9MWX1_9SPHN|nr:peptidylprolyl isomerase [Aurantiacibacter luteus]KLE35104.1 peptidylprolyl isomerase [Aurantiacibacter luteus]
MTDVIALAKTSLSHTLAALGALALGAAAVAPAQAQTVSGSDSFNLPEDVSFILAPLDPNVRRATARVNGSIITGTDVDHRVALILAAQDANVQVSPEEISRLRLQVLRNLIDETLQVQEAEAQEMAVTDEEVNQSYARYAAEARGMSVSEMDAYLASIGSSAGSIKRQIKGELAWDRLLRRNVAPFVNVSEGEVNELYQRLQASRGTTEYRIGEIFLAATPANAEQVRANANQIIEQLRAGGSFVAYARQYSQASSAVQGGDLGWLQVAQLQQPTLEAAVQQMQPGQLVGPLEIPGGYSILLMIDQRTLGMADPRDAVLSLKQISLEFAPGTPGPEIERRAAEFMSTVQAMRGCGDADAAAAAIGASTVDNDAIQVRQLPEAFQNLLLQLNVGQVTPPFGELPSDIRVLMLCGRDDPEQTGGPSVQDIMASLEEDRINRRAQRYRRDLRRDAVIEYN